MPPDTPTGERHLQSISRTPFSKILYPPQRIIIKVAIYVVDWALLYSTAQLWVDSLD